MPDYDALCARNARIVRLLRESLSRDSGDHKQHAETSYDGKL